MRYMMLLSLICVMLGMASAKPPYQEINLIFDGKPVDFRSQIVSRVDVNDERYPCYLVQGHAMVPVRLLNEVLGLHLDLHLEAWGIFSLDACSFRKGYTTFYRTVPDFGGDNFEKLNLPIPPQVINDRLYLPAAASLRPLYYDTAWDAKSRTLIITKRVLRP